MRPIRPLRAFLLGTAIVATSLAANGVLAQEDQLSVLDARATTGAAPGYVADTVCARCHADTYASYQDVGMAKSFRRAGNATVIEEFGSEFYHDASQRYYRISENRGELVFHRYQKDLNDNKINELELPVSWVMGSGNRARSYLHQTDWGEMFLLPLSWYSESHSWGMSPGFESPGHEGIGRSIQRECMFCHNAYPEVATGSDFPYQPELFPKEMPEGTGCQRCHGPGAGHVNAVISGNDIDTIRSAIVNPAKLSAARRDEVCFQCHLLPSNLIPGVRRFERSIYSFRPGENLSDYIINVNAGESGIPETERFEINHHGYRLYQSACFRESEGALGCINCHDPHNKKGSRQFRSEVAEVCTGCHGDSPTRHQASTEIGENECVSCHMPTRRTRDVINVTMTDHWIARGPFDSDELVRPLEAQNSPVTEISVLPLSEEPGPVEAETYTLIAALRANRGVNSARSALGEILRSRQVDSAPPLMEYATSSFSAGQYSDAEETALKIIEMNQYLPQAYKILGVSLMAQNLRRDSVAALTESLRLQPDPEVHFNLAAAYIRYNQPDLAEAELLKAVELRPTMAVAWKYLGLIYKATGRRAQARAVLVRSLQLEPRDLSAFSDLITLLREEGEVAEAERYIELGRRISQSLSE